MLQIFAMMDSEMLRLILTKDSETRAMVPNVFCVSWFVFKSVSNLFMILLF